MLGRLDWIQDEVREYRRIVMKQEMILIFSLKIWNAIRQPVQEA